MLLRTCLFVVVLALPMQAFGNQALKPTHADASGDENTEVISDVNSDGKVDSTDLGIVLNNLGTESGATLSDGDVTGDGKVDSEDLDQVLNAINDDKDDDKEVK